MSRTAIKSHLVESLVAYVFTSCLKAHDHIKLKFNIPKFFMLQPLDEFQGHAQFREYDP
jgi:hypothetical protein